MIHMIVEQLLVLLHCAFNLLINDLQEQQLLESLSLEQSLKYSNSLAIVSKDGLIISFDRRQC